MKKNGLYTKRMWLIGIVIAELAITAVVGCSFSSKTDPEETVSVSTPADSHNTHKLEIVFEEPFPPDVPAQPEEVAVTPDKEKSEKSHQALPKVAIIIDDMGYHPDVGKKLLDLDLNITFSFLPHAPYTAELEQKAYQLGRDILLHQPLEPKDSKWDIGPGGLYLNTSLEKIAPIMKENLDKVPYAIGVNNHMGSKYTEDTIHMRALLAVVKEKNLFFVDSFTTAKSVGMKEALKMGIKTARRQVFLDNVHNPEKICHKLDLLVDKAMKMDFAIAIGHPNKETLMALTNCQNILLDRVDIVGVHELVRH